MVLNFAAFFSFAWLKVQNRLKTNTKTTFMKNSRLEYMISAYIEPE